MQKVIEVCPYCGSGCKINLLVENGRVVGAEGANGVTNEGKLCLKGRYGWDFIHDTKLLTPRLKNPMIRRERGGKLESVSWDEAISYTAKRLLEIREKHGPDAIMTSGSSRSTGNETNYVMQKFARAAIGTNNVDNCARVCHGPSVAGLQLSLGNGAMSNSIVEIEDNKCIFICGWNPADSHPIVGRRVVRAKQKGAKLIVCDPRKIEAARIADLYLPIKNGCNIAFINTMMNVILTEGLADMDYIARYTSGLDELKAIVSKYTPESTRKITGIEPDLLRKAARMYATTPGGSGIYWGMGVTQFLQGVETVRALSSMALLTGNLGKPCTGVGPVRGQNNVQGACDMGALPNVFCGYQPVTSAEVRKKFAKAWGIPVEKLSDKPGIPITEIAGHAEKGTLKAYYCMGEDPFQTEPDLKAVRKGYAALEFLIVQDVFMTKTAAAADVILPATTWGEHEGVYSSADRGFQRFYKAVEPEGDVKVDWEIIGLLSTAMGYPMHYNNTREIWEELCSLSPKYAGATYEKMDANGGLGYVQWPCPDAKSPGTQVLYAQPDGSVKFEMPDGKGKLYTVEWAPPHEKCSEEFPTVLSTVREVGHYSCRSMTGNCKALTALADEPGFVQMNPEDALDLGVADQELVWVQSKRGKVISRASVSPRINRGAVYMTYQWWIGACNELTAEILNLSKTPEYKFVPVRLEKIEDQKWAENYVRQEYSQLKQSLRQTNAEGTVAAYA
ncbi:MAG: formate dehydrogenase subunit alpha [Desulfovibrio sp.]|jgi:formate dehydrogenase major subunit|nr:formate dehydrogenase subunit alpha [Desulfovibrio sp.]